MAMTMLTPHRRGFLGGGGFQTRGFTTRQLSASSANMIYPPFSNHINYSCKCACQNIRRRTCRATCLASSCLSKKLGFAPCQHNCEDVHHVSLQNAIRGSLMFIAMLGCNGFPTWSPRGVISFCFDQGRRLPMSRLFHKLPK